MGIYEKNVMRYLSLHLCNIKYRVYKILNAYIKLSLTITSRLYRHLSTNDLCCYKIIITYNLLHYPQI